MAKQEIGAAVTYSTDTDTPELTNPELTPDEIVLAETILALIAMDYPERPTNLVFGLVGNEIFTESLVIYNNPQTSGIPKYCISYTIPL